MPIYTGTSKDKNIWIGTSKVKNIWKDTNKIYSGETTWAKYYCNWSVVCSGVYSGFPDYFSSDFTRHGISPRFTLASTLSVNASGHLVYSNTTTYNVNYLSNNSLTNVTSLYPGKYIVIPKLEGWDDIYFKIATTQDVSERYMSGPTTMYYTSDFESTVGRVWHFDNTLGYTPYSEKGNYIGIVKSNNASAYPANNKQWDETDQCYYWYIKQ